VTDGVARGRLDALQMRVSERARILEAIPDRAIDADVREPDQAELNGDVRVGDDSDRDQNNREHIGMGSIVGRRSDDRAGQVSDHREVGYQDERHQEPPRVIGAKVERNRRDRNRKSLGAEEYAWGPVDHAATLAAPRQASGPNPSAIRSRKPVMVMRVTLGLLGGLAVVVGVVFIGQGTNLIHGSSMSGHGGYADLGAALLAIGLLLIVWAWRLGSSREA
jgi:hypothetical protein